MEIPGNWAVAARDSCHMDGSQEAVFQAAMDTEPQVPHHAMLHMIKYQDLPSGNLLHSHGTPPFFFVGKPSK